MGYTSQLDSLAVAVDEHGEGRDALLAGLKVHLASNFYPALPKTVKDDIVAAFIKYWDGELDFEDMPEACWLSSTGALVRYFEVYL
jgi:hypothetical protein